MDKLVLIAIGELIQALPTLFILGWLFSEVNEDISIFLMLVLYFIVQLSIIIGYRIKVYAKRMYQA